jgi:hypothetical protein
MGPAIVHRAAGRGTIQRKSLTLASPAPAGVGDGVQGARTGPSSPVSQIGQISRIANITGIAEIAARPSAPGSGTVLPLVQPRRPAARESAAGRGVVQRVSLPPTSPTPALPLARPVQPAGQAGTATGGAVIQRCGSDGSSGQEMTTAEPPGEGGGQSRPTAASVDLEDMVERVMRRLTRSLAVESERHGGRRWP